MDIHTATEQAYKNGYLMAIKIFAEKLKEKYNVFDVLVSIDAKYIDDLADELAEKFK